MIESGQLRDVLSAVGELLEAEGETVRIVVVGGASLNLSGLIDRATDDVDVIARVEEAGDETTLIHPDPMPGALEDAVQRVARDFGLPGGWLTSGISGKRAFLPHSERISRGSDSVDFELASLAVVPSLR